MGWVEAAKWNFILNVLENTVIVFCTWYFISHIEVNLKRKPAVKAAAFGIYGILYALIWSCLRDMEYGSLGVLAFMTAVTLGIGYFIYNNSRLYLFYYFLFPVSIFIVQMLVVYTAFSYNLARWGLTAFDYYNNNVALTARILFILLLTCVWVLLLNRRKYENVSRLQFAGLFLPPLFSIFIIVSLIILGNIYVQMYGAFLIVINITLLVFMNLYILYLFSYLSRNRRLENELEILSQQREMQYHYYEKLERKYQASRRMVHDIRNHLQAMEALIQEGEREAAGDYASGMYQMLNTLGRTQYSDNRMLNIILNDKAENAESLGVRMDVEVRDVHLSQMNDIDITTIFANLLDNAVEAAANACTDKYIRIRAGVFHDFAVIKIENSMPASKNKVKSCGEKHMGIGLENVRRTLQRYGGGIQTETDQMKYKVSITIPMEISKLSEEGCVKNEEET